MYFENFLLEKYSIVYSGHPEIRLRKVNYVQEVEIVFVVVREIFTIWEFHKKTSAS